MKRIATKFWAAMMMLVGVMLLLFFLFQVLFMRETYLTQRTQDVLRAAVSRLSRLTTDQYALEQMLLLEETYNAKFIIQDTTGKTLYRSSSPLVTQMIRNSTEITDMQPLNRDAPAYKRIRLTMFSYELPYQVIASPARTIDGAELVLYILIPVDDTGSMVNTMQRLMLIVSVLLLAIAMPIALLMVRSLTRPLVEIKHAAERMADGHLEVHLDESGNDEIAALNKSINHLGQTLKKTEQLQRELVANISHELRTPLSLIRGYAETVRDLTWRDEAKRSGQLTVIVDESERLRSMVDTILDYSQLQSGLLHPDLHAENAVALVRDSAERFRPEIERGGVALRVNAQGDVSLNIDADKIRQALYNLINNALNHSPVGGTIDVSAIRQHDGLYIEVADSGTGIPPDSIDHIWERFYRAPQQTGRRKRGSGLGLSLVKGIIESHGGTVGVQNRAEGGARFWFKLPLA